MMKNVDICWVNNIPVVNDYMVCYNVVVTKKCYGI